jgi:hypothetical protein
MLRRGVLGTNIINVECDGMGWDGVLRNQHLLAYRAFGDRTSAVCGWETYQRDSAFWISCACSRSLTDGGGEGERLRVVVRHLIVI